VLGMTTFSKGTANRKKAKTKSAEFEITNFALPGWATRPLEGAEEARRGLWG